MIHLSGTNKPSDLDAIGWKELKPLLGKNLDITYSSPSLLYSEDYWYGVAWGFFNKLLRSVGTFIIKYNLNTTDFIFVDSLGQKENIPKSLVIKPYHMFMFILFGGEGEIDRRSLFGHDECYSISHPDSYGHFSVSLTKVLPSEGYSDLNILRKLFKIELVSYLHLELNITRGDFDSHIETKFTPIKELFANVFKVVHEIIIPSKETIRDVNTGMVFTERELYGFIRHRLNPLSLLMACLIENFHNIDLDDYSRYARTFASRYIRILKLVEGYMPVLDYLVPKSTSCDTIRDYLYNKFDDIMGIKIEDYSKLSFIKLNGSIRSNSAKIISIERQLNILYDLIRSNKLNLREEIKKEIKKESDIMCDSLVEQIEINNKDTYSNLNFILEKRLAKLSAAQEIHRSEFDTKLQTIKDNITSMKSSIKCDKKRNGRKEGRNGGKKEKGVTNGRKEGRNGGKSGCNYITEVVHRNFGNNKYQAPPPTPRVLYSPYYTQNKGPAYNYDLSDDDEYPEGYGTLGKDGKYGEREFDTITHIDDGDLSEIIRIGNGDRQYHLYGNGGGKKVVDIKLPLPPTSSEEKYKDHIYEDPKMEGKDSNPKRVIKVKSKSWWRRWF